MEEGEDDGTFHILWKCTVVAVYPRNHHRSSLTPMKSVGLQTAMPYLCIDCLVCICDQFQ